MFRTRNIRCICCDTPPTFKVIEQGKLLVDKLKQIIKHACTCLLSHLYYSAVLKSYYVVHSPMITLTGMTAVKLYKMSIYCK